MMKKLLVIDGNSLMNRAFYGVRPLTTATGLFTNAVYGYVNILKKHLDTLSPDYAVAAFDVHAPTFRHKLFDAYKAGRKPMPEELKMQIPYVRHATELLGFHIVEREGFEADDVLGSLSLTAKKEGVDCYLVTGDRDSLQLVDENVTVILASTGSDVEYTPETIREVYGVSPARLIDVKAIMGDSSDNIPGVKGIGEKGALSLISHFGSLKEVYRNLEDPFLKPAMREKLKNDRDSANLSYVLATIERTMPECRELAPYTRRPFDIPGITELFTELEFVKLLKQFVPQQAPAIEEGEQLTLDTMAPVLPKSEEPVTALKTKELRALFENKKVYAYPAEEAPVFLCEGKFYTFADEEGYGLFAEEGFQKNLAVYRFKELCHYLHQKTGRPIQGLDVGFDASLAAYLVNPSDHISEESLLMIYGSLHPSPNCLKDARYMLRGLEKICPLLYERLEASGMKQLYYTIELPLSYTLAKMETVGFRVDTEALERYGHILQEQIECLEKAIHAEAGKVFNVNSPKQLGTVLFEDLGLPAPKKTKTGYPTDAQTLEKLRGDAPIIDLILDYRTLTKLNGTYAQGLLKAVSPEDGRIHTRFNQTQTNTGRLSSLEPNLQNIPVRTPLGRELRRFFVAENSDWVLVDADYSQIELRILAHLSEDEALIEAFRSGADIHAQTAARIFKVDRDEVTPEMRKAAKAINFGIIYGMGAFSLSKDLNVSLATAKAYIEEYFAGYPRIQGYLHSLIEMAKTNGFVTTHFGRRRYIPELSVTKKNLVAFGERVAMNTPIQGTAADIIKLAMVNVDARLEREGRKARLILQVHDELIIEAPREEKEEVARLLQEEMEKAVKLKVALVAETQVGNSWYDCH